MKNIVIYFLLLVFLISCEVYWIKDYSKLGEGHWVKKIHFKKRKSVGVGCEVIFINLPDFITNEGKYENFNFYEYDSIRIYLKKSDLLSNKLFQSNILKGYFFVDKNKKLPKTDFNNWRGHNIFINRIEEELKDIPPYSMRIKKKLNLYKHFIINADFVGSPYVGADVFQMTLSNKNFKLSQDKIDVFNFIENASIINFYWIGGEI